jgi:hypothetical protein
LIRAYTGVAKARAPDLPDPPERKHFRKCAAVGGAQFINEFTIRWSGPANLLEARGAATGKEY